MSEMISQFIDDELNLHEKSDFVKQIHGDTVFFSDTLEFIEQEIMIRGEVVDSIPDVKIPDPVSSKGFFRHLIRPVSFGLAGALSMAVLMWMVLTTGPQPQHSYANRFVIFQPDVSRVEVMGSFTGWKRIALQPKGDSGYWEITLDIPDGVHRYTYILNGETPIADPTVLAVENDDFGGVNSILTTES